MSKHTKEPWNGKPLNVCFVEFEKLGIAVTIPQYSDEEAKANARRIVACVNACKGLDTEGLERNGLVSAVGYELIGLTKQRDELLAAANAVMEWWEEHQYDCDGDCNRYSDDPEFVVLAREAIAKAKGGAA